MTLSTTPDVADLRERMNLTQAELGQMLGMREPARSIAGWEAQQAEGRALPLRVEIALMMLETIWLAYHHQGRVKSVLGTFLPERLKRK